MVVDNICFFCGDRVLRSAEDSGRIGQVFLAEVVSGGVKKGGDERAEVEMTDGRVLMVFWREINGEKQLVFKFKDD